MDLPPRITIDPDQCGGRPCIRGLRFTVEQLLTLLADGLSREEILREWDFLEPEDFPAALKFAARLAGEGPDRLRKAS